jgi:hypothetical protein
VPRKGKKSSAVLVSMTDREEKRQEKEKKITLYGTKKTKKVTLYGTKMPKKAKKKYPDIQENCRIFSDL